MNTWENSPEYKKAFLIWANYYYSVEEYDRSVCSQMHCFGFEPTAIPTTPEEFHKININAKNTAQFIDTQLSKYQISEELSKQAKLDAGRHKHKELQAILAKIDL